MPHPEPKPLRALERHFWTLPGLSVLVLLAYANSFAGVFQFDDFNVIVHLDVVHSWAAWWADLGQGIRPILKLSYLLNWLSGAGEVGFHAVNLLVHLATVWVVWRLSEAWFQAQDLHRRWPHAAWLAAALFALHPANTEAVTYISGRSSALMALLYLAGLLAHAQRAGQVQSQGRWRWQLQLLPPVCFALALGVKETAVTFPLALLLWDLMHGRSLKVALRNGWASWAVLLAALLYFAASSPYASALQRSADFNTLLGSAATQIDATFYLLRQWALPLWLNIDPDLPVRQNMAQVWPGVLGLALLLMGMVWCWRKRPWLAFAVGWALLHLLPLHSVLPRLDVANDRQLYLASWPLGLALVVELHSWAAVRWPRRAAAAVTSTMLAVLSFALLITVMRNHDYRREVALWEQTVRLSPSKSRVHNNLGYAYWMAGLPVQARRAFLDALYLDTGNVKARLNLRRLNAEQAAKQLP